MALSQPHISPQPGNWVGGAPWIHLQKVGGCNHEAVLWGIAVYPLYTHDISISPSDFHISPDIPVVFPIWKTAFNGGPTRFIIHQDTFLATFAQPEEAESPPLMDATDVSSYRLGLVVWPALHISKHRYHKRLNPNKIGKGKNHGVPCCPEFLMAFDSCHFPDTKNNIRFLNSLWLCSVANATCMCCVFL